MSDAQIIEILFYYFWLPVFGVFLSVMFVLVPIIKGFTHEKTYKAASAHDSKAVFTLQSTRRTRRQNMLAVPGRRLPNLFEKIKSAKSIHFSWHYKGRVF